MSPKEEVESLMDEGFALAETLLKEHGEFYPFGFAMNLDGEIISIGAKGETDHPPSQELIDLLEAAFRQGAEANEYKAIAIFFDVLVAPPGGKKTDAIQVGLEHQSGYCANVFRPYRRTLLGKIKFGELFANRREGSVFGACQ